jgi:agmatine deiminase
MLFSETNHTMARTPSTPRASGFAFPPEWQRQCGTWFSWPRPEGISFPGRYDRIAQNLAGIVREIAVRQDVHINVPNENWQRIVHQQLVAHGMPMRLMRGASQRVYFHFIKTNECWCRDHGPAFVLGPKQRVAVVDWKFNAWGGKYPPWEDDDRVPTEIATRAKLALFHAPIVMEGGSVEFNGMGTVLTTTQCLLNKNRNPGASRARIERHLQDYYGQQHVLWLSEGIEGDDTDGHIDDLARFVNPRTIVVGVELNAKDRFNHLQTLRAARKLRSLRDQDGALFDIVAVPLPKPIVYDGQRCPATPLNFLFVNDAMLVPTFGDRRNDATALAILQEVCPEHKIVGVDCRELIWGLGAVHCLSQQVPEAAGLRDRLRSIAEPALR